MKALTDLVQRHKRGEGVGIYSLCSAHPRVIEAAMHEARVHDTPLLIEATCNQVNQFGGYTGMTPADFRGFVHAIADRIGIHHAFFLPVICYLYILYFALSGSKPNSLRYSRT